MNACENEFNLNNNTDTNNFLESINDSFFRSDSRLSHTEIKRKRRSKNDQEGRQFKCECGKAYLSQLALNNHIKSKHEVKEEIEEDTLSVIKKARGRPKKSVFNIKKSYYKRHEFNVENYLKHFFEKDFRKKKNNESLNLEDYYERVYHDVYFRNKERCELKIASFKEHPLHLSLDKLYIQSNEDLPCDAIFRNYLIYTKDLVNKEYFLFVFRFVVIFRECVNTYKNIELQNTREILGENIDPLIKEFTEYYCGEHLPDICNEFICEYLKVNNYFGLSAEYYPEFIEIIQHFCYWLYENNYTSSKLTLIG